MRLSVDDAAVVLRRAAELTATPDDDGSVLDERTVAGIGKELGLPEQVVRQAVAEWRRGDLRPVEEVRPRVVAGIPADAVVDRIVRASPAQAQAVVEGWLRQQWFERRRVSDARSQWRPRQGMLARARRAVDFGGSLRLDGVREIDVCVVAAGPGARVQVRASLAARRKELLGGMVGTPIAVGGAVVLLSAGAAGPEALLAVPGVAALAGGGWLGARRLVGRAVAAVEYELQCVLDRLDQL